MGTQFIFLTIMMQSTPETRQRDNLSNAILSVAMDIRNRQETEEATLRSSMLREPPFTSVRDQFLNQKQNTSESIAKSENDDRVNEMTSFHLEIGLPHMKRVALTSNMIFDHIERGLWKSFSLQTVNEFLKAQDEFYPKDNTPRSYMLKSRRT